MQLEKAWKQGIKRFKINIWINNSSCRNQVDGICWTISVKEGWNVVQKSLKVMTPHHQKIHSLQNIYQLQLHHIKAHQQRKDQRLHLMTVPTVNILHQKPHQSAPLQKNLHLQEKGGTGRRRVVPISPYPLLQRKPRGSYVRGVWIDSWQVWSFTPFSNFYSSSLKFWDFSSNRFSFSQSNPQALYSTANLLLLLSQEEVRCGTCGGGEGESSQLFLFYRWGWVGWARWDDAQDKQVKGRAAHHPLPRPATPGPYPPPPPLQEQFWGWGGVGGGGGGWGGWVGAGRGCGMGRSGVDLSQPSSGGRGRFPPPLITLQQPRWVQKRDEGDIWPLSGQVFRSHFLFLLFLCSEWNQSLTPFQKCINCRTILTPIIKQSLSSNRS